MLVSHPIVLLVVAVTRSATVLFPWRDLNLAMLTDAVKQSIMFSTMDRYIYGSWILTLGCILLLPVWLVLWSILNCGQKNAVTVNDKKDD